MADPNSPQVQQWRDAVTAAFGPANADIALWVMAHESGGKPGAVDYANSGHNGLFQVAGGSFDPMVNIQQAASMFNASGWAPWGGGSNTYTTNWGPLSASNLEIFARSGDRPPGYTGPGSGGRGGGTANVSAPVATIAPTAPPYANDQARYDFLKGQQAAGGRLGPDALAFINSYGGSPAPAAPSPNLVAPGSQYQSDQQRYDYLSNLVAQGVPIGQDAQNFLATFGQGQQQTATQTNASALGPIEPYVDAAGGYTQSQSAPAFGPAPDPYGFQSSSGVYGNQTTTNNMAAQNAYQDTLAYQQQATAPQSGFDVTSYDPTSGAYQGTIYSPAGVGTNVGGYMDNSNGGSEFNTNGNGIPDFGYGGTAMVGSSGKAKMAPTLAIGAPFNPETMGMFPSLGRGGNVDAPEPIVAVGKFTGIPYFEAGEVPGERETITVTPEGEMPPAPFIPGDHFPRKPDDEFSFQENSVLSAMPWQLWRGIGNAKGLNPMTGNPIVSEPRPEPDFWGYNPPGDHDTTPIIPPVDMPVNINPVGDTLQHGSGQTGWMLPREYQYADGGTATVGSPFADIFDKTKELGQQAQPIFQNYGPQAFSGYGDPNALKLSNQRNLLNSQLASIGPSQNYLNSLGNYYNAQGGVLQARQGTFGPQQAYIGAQGNVIGAQEQQTAGERQYLGQAMGDNQQTQQEEAAYQAAERNIPDLTATGQAKNYQDSLDYQYRLAGVAPPEDVDTRGQALPSGSPPTVRAKIQSQADILKANNSDAQRMRNLQLEGARLAVQLLGTNVDAARQAAARVGLTVDQAKLMVQQAELGADQAQLESQKANLGVRQADLNTEQLRYSNALSELPPRAGLDVYTNPFTGESSYMTPAQARIQESADTAAIRDQIDSSPGGARSLSVSQIQSGIRSGLVSEEEAYDALIGKGYTPSQAQVIITQAKTRRSGGTTRAPSPDYGGPIQGPTQNPNAIPEKSKKQDNEDTGGGFVPQFAP